MRPGGERKVPFAKFSSWKGPRTMFDLMAKFLWPSVTVTRIAGILDHGWTAEIRPIFVPNCQGLVHAIPEGLVMSNGQVQLEVALTRFGAFDSRLCPQN